MARKLRFFQAEITKAGLTARAHGAADHAPPSLDELEGRLSSLEAELLEINGNAERLRRSHSELMELQLVLEKAGGFFDEARTDAGVHQREMELGAGGGASTSGWGGGGGESSMSTPFLGGSADAETGFRGAEHKAVRLGFVTGIVAQERVPSFERVLFRATRGNMFLRTAAVDGTVSDPGTGERVAKTVFIVFFAGERARAKVLKICEAFGANRYPFPEDITRQRQMNSEVNARLRELHTTIEASSVHRDGLLAQVGSSVEDWASQVRRDKAVYHALNLFSVDVTHKCLVAEGWCPVGANARVQAALVAAASRSAAQTSPIMQVLSTRETPPTYFRTTKVTQVFQGIVDAYGVANYQEANPAVYTMVTFPFLFAVMFGDLGHGILMLLFAAYMVVNERALGAAKLDEITGMMFGGRYIILPMALFSIYTGLLYNECFSCPMTLFGGSNYDYAEGNVPTWNGKTYAFGLDPAWHGTKGELPFTNSMKMKMSIIMGVAQMDLGIIMSLMNALYFRKPVDIWHGFVPQIIFLNGLFGYLALLIVIKWVSGSQADLYHVMIYMFLSPGTLDKENTLFPGQAGLQVLLVLVCVACVPWMLFTKPMILKKQHEARSRGYTSLADNAVFADDGEDDEGDGHGSSGDGDGGFDFGDTMVHQMIHTIEFVLGAVSNTASYLRLWALSLAHAQLSAVFWDRMLLLSVTLGPAAMIIGFGAWFGATIGVLMTMESLSAFLHALRLHWVEYQNKFFGGEGKAFEPFDLDKIEQESEAEAAAAA